MKLLLAGIIAVALTVGWSPGTIHADIISTVWNAGGGGAGSGTLDGVNVSYTTSNTHGGGGTFTTDWLGLLTSQFGMAVASVSSDTAGTLVSIGTATPQTITFSSSVSNPIIFINWLSTGDSFDFGALNITLLGANKVSRSSNIVSADLNASGDSPNEGFALQFNGTFNSLAFNYSGIGNPSVGFTVATSVPEPSTYALLCISLGVVGFARKKMRKSEA